MQAASEAPLLESLSALADGTRCRMLLVLERQELTVGELCTVLQLPQSTVSRHLKTLTDAGLLISRREGTSRYYGLTSDVSSARGGERAAGGEAAGPLSDAAAPIRLWQITRGEVATTPAAMADARRLQRVLARRRETSRQYFATTAGEWDRVRDELFGAGRAIDALVGLLPSEWVVGDLGCGTGAALAAMAPFVGRAIGVDASDEMLAAAAARLGASSNVDLRHGTLEALPLTDATLNAATMVLVLHHVAAPAEALAEAHRVLVPGGRLLIVDMLPHEREEFRREMGHVWLGFSEEHIRRVVTSAGFSHVRVHPLPPTDAAQGPALFAATATR